MARDPNSRDISNLEIAFRIVTLIMVAREKILFAFLNDVLGGVNTKYRGNARRS